MKSHFTIGEISKLYGIGADSIRYYEELGLIAPTRNQNRYRNYSIKDIWRMNVIRDLRSLDFTIEQIRNYFTSHSVDSTISELQNSLFEISTRIDRLQKIERNVEKRLEAMEYAKKLPIGVIELTEFTQRSCHEIQQPFSSDEEMDILLKQLLNRINSNLHIIGNNNIGARIDPHALSQGDFNHYKGVFILDESNEDTNGFIEGGDYLTIRYNGSSQCRNTFIPLLTDHAGKHGMRASGEVIELIIVDIHEAGDYSEHITEIQMRVD